MRLRYDFRRTDTTEFGVGKEGPTGQIFTAVTVDRGVQATLGEMAQATWTAMQENTSSPERYDPSEKHSEIEHLYLPLDDDMTKAVRNLHTATNLPLDAGALARVSELFCYFARFTDGTGQQLTALRRATQFKGALGSRFLRLDTNALKLVRDRLFKLDRDFDLLIDSAAVHVLRPSGFEFAGKLQEAILGAVPENIKIIQRELPFVDFSGIRAYAMQHPRAARYLASIQSQDESKNIDKGALKALCRATDVNFTESKGRIVVADDQVLGFLEVVDRRRYYLELVKGSPERFKAASRQKLIRAKR